MDDILLKAVCRKWQSKLGLRDWDVEISFSGLDEIQREFGTITFFLPKRWARIRILPESLRSEMTPYESEEHTVVHELMHLHFALYDTKQTRMSIEQTIHSLTKALLAIS